MSHRSGRYPSRAIPHSREPAGDEDAAVGGEDAAERRVGLRTPGWTSLMRIPVLAPSTPFRPAARW
jgi:hypothetical protein